MAMKIELARNLLYKATMLKQNHKPFELEATMSKLYCSEVAKEVADEAVQIHGGYGNGLSVLHNCCRRNCQS